MNRMGTDANLSLMESNVQTAGESYRTGIAGSAWVFLILASVITFLAFMRLDPDPNTLFSACCALNVAIMLWATFRLYELRLLLSPMAAVVIGPAWIIQYSWGNLFARMAGETRYASNPGSLEYYSLVALLTTVGLVLFCWVCFGLFAGYARYYRIRYEDLNWQPWQAITTSLLAVVILAYLSSKYAFLNGYFYQVQGQFDLALSASCKFFLILALTVSVSVMLKSKNLTSALLGFAGVVLPLALSLGLRSRTFMITQVIALALYWLTLRPDHVRRVLLISVVASGVLYVYGTVVKDVSGRGQTVSVTENFRALVDLEFDTVKEINSFNSLVDAQYHLAGYELPAALLSSITRGGASPAYGDAFVGGALSALPRFLRPEGAAYSERLSIYRTFFGKGLRYADSIGIPLTSGVADLGLFGFLIYAFMGIYCILAWHLVQISPRIFLAYLIIGVGPGDLFWENAFFSIRALAFVWLTLLALSPFLMPKWSPLVSESHEHTENRSGGA